MLKPRVDPGFRAQIPPLTPEESGTLEAAILRDGCRDALVVWKEEGVLLDGHNRLRICEAHGLPYRTEELSLPGRDVAEDWIDANQLGRRNLSPDAASLLRGRRYNRAKKAEGRPEKLGKSCLVSGPTAERLAAEHGVSPRTMKNDGAFAAAVEKTKATDPDIEAKVLAGKVNRSDIVRSVKRTAVKEQLAEVVRREVAEPTGLFDVVVVDPPWPMQKIERDCRPNQVGLDYPTMNEEQLAALEIPAADDCHLFLWTTHRFLPMAFRLLIAWGFAYVCTFVWHKPGGYQVIGLPQYNCEFALYARRGTPAFLDTKALPTCFNAARGAHSEKPEEFYATLRRVTGGRRIDLFNRRKIEGFSGWGQEAK